MTDSTSSRSTSTGEIYAQGYTGSVQTVCRYLHRFRSASCTTPAGSTMPTVRQTSRWLMTHHDRLDPEDRAQLKASLEHDLMRLADVSPASRA
jgi:hypothetical protein